MNLFLVIAIVLIIKELSRYKIEKLLISEKTFEDMFMNYYEIKGEK